MSETRIIKYTPVGSLSEITLTLDIVLKTIAQPTKSGKMPTPRDAALFIMLCEAQGLNPYAGDCFLIGYDTQQGPKFSMIVSHAALLKRAETNPSYNGMTSGVIVQIDKDIKMLDGDFMPPESKLLGGWAVVHRKGIEFTPQKTLNLASRRKPTQQWTDDPAGMIVKCAEADALRTAFPASVGNLRMAAEGGMDLASIPIEAEAQPAPKPVEVATVTVEPLGDMSPCDAFAEAVLAAGFSFEQFAETAKERNWLDRDVTSFGEIGEKRAKELLKAGKLIVSQLMSKYQKADA